MSISQHRIVLWQILILKKKKKTLRNIILLFNEKQVHLQHKHGLHQLFFNYNKKYILIYDIKNIFVSFCIINKSATWFCGIVQTWANYWVQRHELIDEQLALNIWLLDNDVYVTQNKR